MKKVLGALGIFAACAACCAIPLALPALGALVATGTGLAVGWECGVMVLLLAAGYALYRHKRNKELAAQSCAPAEGSCGCAAQGGEKQGACG